MLIKQKLLSHQLHLLIDINLYFWYSNYNIIEFFFLIVAENIHHQSAEAHIVSDFAFLMYLFM